MHCDFTLLAMKSSNKLKYPKFFFLLLLSSFATGAGSPQQREPITMDPYYLSHPVNFPCGRKPEYPEKTLTILFSHEDWVRVHLTGDRTRNLRGERRVV